MEENIMNNKKTMVSFFSGGGGFDMGAMLAGFKPIAAYEYMEKIAAVYRNNLGDHIHVISILDIIINMIPWAQLFHFSPPCPNFSNAKKDKGETEADLSLAGMICEIIKYHLPLYVTLENVYGYRKSKSFAMIIQTLRDLGYSVKWWKLNAANYGVPQTRERLILIARRDGKPVTQPRSTHEKTPRPLFGLLPWVGWYEAIEDLIPTLKDTHFAPWQLSKLPKWFDFDRLGLVEQVPQGDRQMIMRKGEEPSNTLTTSKGGRVSRAFIPHNQANSRTDGRNGSEPIYTIAAKKPPENGFMGYIPQSNSRESTPLNGVIDTDPVYTIRAGKAPNRAFIMNAANPNGNEKRKYRETQEPEKTITAGDSLGIKCFIIPAANSTTSTAIDEGDPMVTLTSNPKGAGFERAFIIPGGNANSARPRSEAEPAQTIGDTNRTGNIPRAATPNGRIVKLSIRALARLQSFPNWYTFPTKKKKSLKLKGDAASGITEEDTREVNKGLSCTIIGNSVPPLLAEAICKTLI